MFIHLLGDVMALSSSADYPKNGIPVDTTNLPKTLMRCNPDWQAAEVLKPRDTDFYHSDRALGHLYRAITLAELPEETKPDIPPLQDAVSVALQNELHDVLSIQLEDEVPSAMLTLFNKLVYSRLFWTAWADHPLDMSANFDASPRLTQSPTRLEQHLSKKNWSLVPS